MLLSEKIEQVCMELIQHDVKFTCNGKTLRQGKLLLVAQRGHYIGFTVTNQHDIPKLYEVPYPYDYYFDPDHRQIVFDYRLKILCNDNIHTQLLIDDLPVKKPHRLYNSVLQVDSIV